MIVREELTRHLPEGWNTVIETDIDGPRSLPYRIDSDHPRLGQVMAARRVARSIFLGSAPSVKEQRVRGIEPARALGCGAAGRADFRFQRRARPDG